MNASSSFRDEKVDRLVDDLTRTALRMERLVNELPTTDSRILAELDRLSRTIDHLVAQDSGRERSTMFLEQARRKALYQKDRYLDKVHSGSLRHR